VPETPGNVVVVSGHSHEGVAFHIEKLFAVAAPARLPSAIHRYL
jgi:hypothetical protein